MYYTPIPDYKDRLFWHIFLRALFITILFSTTIILRAYDENAFLSSTLIFIYVLISISYVASFIFWMFLRFYKFGNIHLFSTIQIIWDIIFTTAVIYLTGGFNSIFTFMYLLNIVNATILRYKGGGIAASYASCIFYGGLSILQYYGFLSFSGHVLKADEIDAIEVAIKVITNISLFLIIGHLAVHITENLRQAEGKLIERTSDLERANRLNENIVRLLSDGLLIVDNNLEVIFMNERFGQIFPHIESIRNKSFLPTFLPFLDEKRIEQLLKLDRDNPKLLWDEQISYSRDKTQYINLTGQIIPGKNEDRQIMLLVHDYTEYKRMEDRLRVADKLAAIGHMAAGIAHEIRNPLASISGSVQLLSREIQLEGENQRLMEIVLREINRLNSLITDFLVFAKPQILNQRQIDCKELVDNVVKLLMADAKYIEKIRIEINIAENLAIKADDKQIQQIFWNIIQNAIEAMEFQGSIKITVLKMGELVDFVIEDDGPGIASDVIKKIFDPFYTTKQKGTGLGLSIAYQIVEAHLGKIYVENKDGGGTKFHVLLPRMKKD